MKDPIQNLYDKMAEHERDVVRAHKRPPRRFRASEAANCVRQIWYRLSGYRPAARDAVGNMYGVAGDLDHDLTRQIINHYEPGTITGVTQEEDGEMKELLYVQKQFEVEHAGGTYKVDVISRADGEIETPRGKCLLEIKGTGHWPYDWLRKTYQTGGLKAVDERIRGTAEKEYRDAKHKSWYAQCQVTMTLTGHTLAYLLVKDRGSNTLGVFKEDADGKPIPESRTGIHIERDEAFWQKLLQRFAYVVRKLEEGKPPVAEFTAGSKDCLYCPFNYLCHGRTKREAAGETPAILYPGPQIDIHVGDTELPTIDEEYNG